MKITLPDAVHLLMKYADEHIPVLAAFVTPSRSTATVTGIVHISMLGDIPQLQIGEDDQESDRITFLLSDCVFEYGDFREESDARRFEAFLVIASSKKDTLSPFETKGRLLQCSR
jgi:hypothetical protein